MHCPVCENEMELLRDLYLHSARQYYGCKKCDIVIEKKLGGGGENMGTELYPLSYEEYQKIISQKKKEKK